MYVRVYMCVCVRGHVHVCARLRIVDERRLLVPIVTKLRVALHSSLNNKKERLVLPVCHTDTEKDVHAGRQMDRQTDRQRMQRQRLQIYNSRVFIPAKERKKKKRKGNSEEVRRLWVIRAEHQDVLPAMAPPITTLILPLSASAVVMCRQGSNDHCRNLGCVWLQSALSRG